MKQLNDTIAGASWSLIKIKNLIACHTKPLRIEIDNEIEDSSIHFENISLHVTVKLVSQVNFSQIEKMPATTNIEDRRQ